MQRNFELIPIFVNLKNQNWLMSPSNYSKSTTANNQGKSLQFLTRKKMTTCTKLKP